MCHEEPMQGAAHEVALGLGVPIKVISERLGHASITTTMDIYTHLLPPMDQEAASTLEAILDLADGDE